MLRKLWNKLAGHHDVARDSQWMDSLVNDIMMGRFLNDNLTSDPYPDALVSQQDAGDS